MPISANTVKMPCQVKTAQRKCEMRANLKNAKLKNFKTFMLNYANVNLNIG